MVVQGYTGSGWGVIRRRGGGHPSGDGSQGTKKRGMFPLLKLVSLSCCKKLLLEEDCVVGIVWDWERGEGAGPAARQTALSEAPYKTGHAAWTAVCTLYDVPR